MHSAIFFVDSGPNLQKWGEFQTVVKRNKAITEHATKLDERVWLVSFEASPLALSSLVSLAEANDLRYGVSPSFRSAEMAPRRI